jgi:hypothetical protein
MDREKPVDQQIDPDRQLPDGDGRDHGRHAAEIDGLGIVADHAPPIGIRRLYAQAKEAERGDEQEGEAEAQAEFRDQRRQGIGQDLAPDDPAQPLAPQPCAST